MKFAQLLFIAAVAAVVSADEVEEEVQLDLFDASNIQMLLTQDQKDAQAAIKAAVDAVKKQAKDAQDAAKQAIKDAENAAKD